MSTCVPCGGKVTPKPTPTPVPDCDKFIVCVPPTPPDEKYCCGEGYIVFDGPCDTKIRSKWVSEADPVKLTATIDALLLKLQELYSGPAIVPSSPESLLRILSLGIFCQHSTIQNLPGGGSGVGVSTEYYPSTTIGIGAAYQLALLLEALKATNGFLEFSVQKRLQENDLLYLVISFTVYSGPPSDPTRTVLYAANMYGQWYVVQCGSGLCIDWVNISRSLSLIPQ